MIYCLLLVLLGGAFLLFTIISFRIHTRETLIDGLAVRAQEILVTSEEFIDRPPQLADVIEKRFSPEAQGRFIRIRVGSRLIYQSPDPLNGEFIAADVPWLNSRLAPQTRLVGDLLLYSRNFQVPDIGDVTIATGQSFRFAIAAEARLAKALLIGLPPMLLLAALAGYVLMRRVLIPVEVMIKAAESYTFSDPKKRLPLIGTEPRIEALSLALNRMLDRLDNAYSYVSRFSADAAHELRTPLTIIRGELELVAVGGKSPTEVNLAIGNALEEMTRLSGIVDSLITLSRMDSLWGKRFHSNIDLLELALETMDQLSLLAVDKEINLTKPSGHPVVVAGDRERLKQVLVNLLDNAIKYTPSGGHVTVHTGIEGDHGFVSVEDNGIGIDPNNHDRIFERFYRVSTDRGEAGAGLGLAIVKSICQAHGGTVSVRSVPRVGSWFAASIPLAHAEDRSG